MPFNAGKKPEFFQFITILIRAVIYVLLSLAVAYVTFGLLSSSGSFAREGFSFGGAAAGFFATLILLLRFDRYNFTLVSKEKVLGFEKIPSSEQYSKEYIARIVSTISSANSSVKLHFPMLRASVQGDIPREVNDAIRDVAQSVFITIITCAEYDRLAGAFELNRIENVSVFFSSELRSSDLRFTLIDVDDAIIGVNPNQERQSEYHRSMEWVRLRSIKLSHILDKYFEELKSRSKSYEDYAKEQVVQYIKGSDANYKVAAKNLNLPESEVMRLINKA